MVLVPEIEKEALTVKKPPDSTVRFLDVADAETVMVWPALTVTKAADDVGDNVAEIQFTLSEEDSQLPTAPQFPVPLLLK
mgnify:CR=1 FL=1